MKKIDKKGFTLIELLAVIVILGLLMAIAIPAVTKYITQSRKKTLVSTIDSFISEVTNSVNNMDFGSLSDPSKLYYIRVAGTGTDGKNISCISLEKGGTNPFGDWDQAYVAVHYNPTTFSYDYYFTFFDKGGYGMVLTEADKIATSGNDIKNPTTITAANITKQTTAKGGAIKYKDASDKEQAVTTSVINPASDTGICSVSTATAG